MSKINDADRSGHEDAILAQAIQLAVEYDQLNIVNLASFELLMRRRQLITEAHRLNPSAPDYSGSEHYMGVSDSVGGGIVMPALAAHVAERLAASSKVRKERRLIAEEQREANKKKPNGKGDKGAGKGANDQ